MSHENSVEQTMEPIIGNLQEEVGVLRQQSKITNRKCGGSENIVDELADSLRDQDAFTRKDSVPIMNPPFDASRKKFCGDHKIFRKLFG